MLEWPFVLHIARSRCLRRAVVPCFPAVPALVWTMLHLKGLAVNQADCWVRTTSHSWPVANQRKRYPLQLSTYNLVNPTPSTSWCTQYFASLIIFEQWWRFLRDLPLLEAYHTFPVSANRGSVLSNLPYLFHPAITYPPVQQHSTRNSFEIHHDDGCKLSLLWLRFQLLNVS